MRDKQIIDYLLVFILGIAFGLVILKLFNIKDNRLKAIVIISSILALHGFYFIVRLIDIHKDKKEINIIENLSSETVEEEV